MTAIQPKDTTFTKIFVGGLPYHTSDASLRAYFEHFGDIDEAVVITDRQTGKSRGYGFVTMSDRLSAERACKDPNPIIDGRKANVNLAYLGAKPRGIQATVLPIALKTGVPAGFLHSQFGVPQYIYPPGYLSAMPATLPLLPQTVSISQATAAAAAAGHFIDYTSTSSSAAAAAASGYPTGTTAQVHHLTTGYDALQPIIATNGSPYMNAAAAAAAAAATYPYVMSPHGFGQLSAFQAQPQQIGLQERLH